MFLLVQPLVTSTSAAGSLAGVCFHPASGLSRGLSHRLHEVLGQGITVLGALGPAANQFAHAQITSYSVPITYFSKRLPIILLHNLCIPFCIQEYMDTSYRSDVGRPGGEC